MKSEYIKCPSCGYEIAISEALTNQVREHLKHETDEELKKQEALLAQRQALVNEKEKELNQARASINEQVEAKLKEASAKIHTEEEKKALGKVKDELEDLKAQITEKEKIVSEAKKGELDLRKKNQELKERTESLELEVARKIDTERESIKRKAYERFSEDHRLKDAEKDKIINDLKKSLDDAKRKAEQGSTQIQGEVLELDIESNLKSAFPDDDILPVPKGEKGADAIQKVFNPARKYCGTILWESKNTKNWSDKWLQKLKDDQREISADIAIISTETMPKNSDGYLIFKDNVWVVIPHLSIGIATALRHQLIDIAFSKNAAVGKNEKLEALYHYMSGLEFKQKMEAIVESFTMMQTQLEKEKRAMEAQWKAREKQIQRVVTNTAGLYGDMRGIIGASLPEVKSLELGVVDKPKQIEHKKGRKP